ncbi:MAG: hypothetical protein KGS72_25460 [Cyanobacteria bacterium REEB67]|nr:hypothetical protein [Cyanobacteria bacterium REEB67]
MKAARPRLAPILPALLVGLLHCPIAPASARAAAEKGYHLEQTSSALGQLKIDISPTFFRLENERAGTVSYANAPDWQVTTYNKQRRIYYVMPAQKFTARFAMFSGSFSRHTLCDMHFARTKSIPYKKTAFNVRCLEALKDDVTRSKENEEQIWNTHIKIIEDKNLPKQPLQILCRLYFLPQLDGLPVECQATVDSSSTGTRRKRKDVLTTTSLKELIYRSGDSDKQHPDLSAFKKYPDETSYSNANNGDRMDVKDFADYIGH